MLKQELGLNGEKLALKKLKQMRYKIIEKNFWCKIGEIDIIAKDKDILVFVEVRTRKWSKYGLPEETINYKKQAKVRKVAEWYLVKNKLNDVICRFDAIGIIWDRENKIKMEVIKNAF